MKETAKIFAGICVFSIAMAALESAVVVYLRALYYPDGFSMDFRVIDEEILKVELLRELATLVMLGSIGYLVGRNLKERLAYFLLSFAVWDIFYYGWLKVLLDWPASIFEWDVLFLIPFTWLGPVWAPLVCSVTMIALAVVLITGTKPISSLVWTLLFGGSFLILYTFMEDYGKIIVNNGFLDDYPRLVQNPDFLKVISSFVPHSFNWIVFWLGEFFLIAGVFFQHRGFSGLRNIVSYPFSRTGS